MQEVSVIIPNYNGMAYLEGVLCKPGAAGRFRILRPFWWTMDLQMEALPL